MDSYELYRTRQMLENIMPQALLRVDQDNTRKCVSEGCKNPAAESYNHETREMETSLCYDCTVNELKKIVGIPLANQLSESVTDEVEMKAKTFSIMQKIIAEAAKKYASNT